VSRAAVLVTTSVGAVEGIVHVPDGASIAAAVVVPGADSRAGTNRKWARLGDALAERGIVALRYDAVDEADLGDAAQTRAREVIDWFRDRSDTADLLLCGLCYGARACVTYAASHPPLGLALVTPLLRRRLGRKDRLSVHASQVLTRIATRTGVRLPSRRAALDPPIARALEQIGSSPSPWILLGERDYQWRSWWSSKAPRELSWSTLEVVPELQLHSSRTLEVQETTIERVSAWATRTLQERVQR
jgi:hypothetical protein